MTLVVVVLSQPVRASKDRVWEVLNDPRSAAAIDPRTSFVSGDGPPGVVGSSYVLSMKMFGRTLFWYVLVAVADAPTHLVQEYSAARALEGHRHPAGRQSYEIDGDADVATLRATVEFKKSRPLARYMRGVVSRRLGDQLNALAVIAESGVAL
jgi:hypothetical protein